MHLDHPDSLALSSLPDYAMLGLTMAALVVILLLIIILETAALQMTRWGDFKRSLRISFIMNLLSTPFGFLIMAQVPRIGLSGLLIAWTISVLIEWLVLTRRGSGERRTTLMVAMVANLTSYLILILPSFMYAS